MLRIPCPYCGLRDQVEFRHGGPVNRDRPANPESASDRDWSEYLFYRENPRGEYHERWVHAFGCRQWFTLVRNTLTHTFSPAPQSDESS